MKIAARCQLTLRKLTSPAPLPKTSFSPARTSTVPSAIDDAGTGEGVMVASLMLAAFSEAISAYAMVVNRGVLEALSGLEFGQVGSVVHIRPVRCVHIFRHVLSE